jgi:hypothetical protein
MCPRKAGRGLFCRLFSRDDQVAAATRGLIRQSVRVVICTRLWPALLPMTQSDPLLPLRLGDIHRGTIRELKGPLVAQNRPSVINLHVDRVFASSRSRLSSPLVNVVVDS